VPARLSAVASTTEVGAEVERPTKAKVASGEGEWAACRAVAAAHTLVAAAKARSSESWMVRLSSGDWNWK